MYMFKTHIILFKAFFVINNVQHSNSINYRFHAGFDVFMAIKIQVTVFWVVMLCNNVVVHNSFIQYFLVFVFLRISS